MMKAKCGKCGDLLGSCACRRQRCQDSVDGDPLVFIDGHDDAILGLAEIEGDTRVVYDHGAVIRRLMRRDGMDEEGAEEFFSYNIEGSKILASPPIFLRAC